MLVLYIWGMKGILNFLNFLKEFIKFQKVEDGFRRSISLGSDLTRPYSLIVDSSGIYIDPKEHQVIWKIFLQNSDFDAKIKDKTKTCEKYLKINFQNITHFHIKI